MGEYKTPGVYIKEKNAFGNSIVEAETAIPSLSASPRLRRMEIHRY